MSATWYARNRFKGTPRRQAEAAQAEMQEAVETRSWVELRSEMTTFDVLFDVWADLAGLPLEEEEEMEAEVSNAAAPIQCILKCDAAPLVGTRIDAQVIALRSFPPLPVTVRSADQAGNAAAPQAKPQDDLCMRRLEQLSYGQLYRLQNAIAG